MAKRMTAAQARREWAKVLRSAQRGTPVTVTRNGEPVAVVISIDEYRKIAETKRETLSDVIAELRSTVDPSDLEGPDPWADVRDRSPGRDVDLGLDPWRSDISSTPTSCRSRCALCPIRPGSVTPSSPGRADARRTRDTRGAAKYACNSTG